MHYIEESVIESTGDVFFDLVSCIMEQQIHYLPGQWPLYEKAHGADP